MPNQSTAVQPSLVGRYAATVIDYGVHYAVEIVLITFILYICITRGMTFDIDIYDPDSKGEAAVITEAVIGGVFAFAVERSQSILTFFEVPVEEVKEQPTTPVAAVESKGFDDFNSVAQTNDPAPHISNLTLVLSPDYGERKGLDPEIIKAKKQRVQHYLERYAPIAQREMKEYGIPASITLAQGLLESNAGDSKLAVKSKNHFGIKCRSKCLGCTCRNYKDDSRYDMFRVFESVAESYREHSKLLNTSRYAKLKKHGTDYVKWAHGLKACGYATDKRYGYKLVKIIENLGLARYDEVLEE